MFRCSDFRLLPIISESVSFPIIAFPLLFAAFRPFLPMMTPQDSFRVVDCFVVKYNASSGQKELKPHRDGSIFSFNVAPNDLDEYSDGGTSFRALAMTKGSAETSEWRRVAKTSKGPHIGSLIGAHA